MDVIGDGIDDFNLQGTVLGFSDLRKVDLETETQSRRSRGHAWVRTYLSKLENLVLGDGLGLLKDFVGDVLRSGTTVGYIVLDTEVVVWSTGVVRRRKKDTTIGLVLPDDVRRGGSRKDPVSADDKLGHAVRGSDLDDNLDGLWREITTIATNNEREALWLDGIEDGLYEVLRVVLSNPDEH